MCAGLLWGLIMRATRVGEVQDRFWQRVDKGGPDECWNWTGTSIKDGYGVISGVLMGKRYVPKGGKMLAHRVSWIMANGPIPELDEYHGSVIMHACDNPRCVNPAHLVLGTQKANVHDMIAKQRDVRGKGAVGTKHKRAKLTDEQVAEIRASELGTVELANKFGVGRHTIQRARYGRSYAEGAEAQELLAGPRVRTGLKGSNNPSAKVTDDLVREIRASDFPAVRWAERLGVTPETIANIRHRRTYKHIS